MFAVRLCDHPVTNVNVVSALDGRRQGKKFGFFSLALAMLRGQSAGGADSRTEHRAFPHYAVVARS